MEKTYSGLVQKVFKSGFVVTKAAGCTYTLRSAVPVSSLKEKSTVILSKNISGKYFILGRN